MSYYDGSACHLDLSQWATDPTWNELDGGIRQRLIADGAPFLAEQLRNEMIELLLLNGRAVINGFATALGAQLSQVATVDGGRTTTAFYAGRYERVRVIGWSTNLQSSFGVTSELGARLLPGYKRRPEGYETNRRRHRELVASSSIEAAPDL